MRKSWDFKAILRTDELKVAARPLSFSRTKPAPCDTRLAMSYDVGDGDLVLCVDASPNHVNGDPVPLVRGETYTVYGILPFMCPCGRGDALLDVGVGFAWCQTRFRLLPKPRKQEEKQESKAPIELEEV